MVIQRKAGDLIMKKSLLKILVGSSLSLSVGLGASTALTAVTSDTGLFEKLSANCGKAFMGRTKLDTADSETYRDVDIILHVRDCSANQIQMPMHVGDNHSRTLIISKLDDGRLQLQHRHTHEDGSADDLTLYGGFSKKNAAKKGANDNNRTEFHVGDYTRKLFIEHDIQRSLANVWAISMGQDTATYELHRPSLDFIIEFDLSNIVTNPPKAW